MDRQFNDIERMCLATLRAGGTGPSFAAARATLDALDACRAQPNAVTYARLLTAMTEEIVVVERHLEALRHTEPRKWRRWHLFSRHP